MIDLSLYAEFSDTSRSPFIAKLGDVFERDTATLIGEIENNLVFQFDDLTFQIQIPEGQDLLGDVMFVEPEFNRVSRWIRKTSSHNTLLVTERCDQLCIMCSQPPKKTHIDTFEHMEKACLLAPQNIIIGFSGGEPLLYKEQLFSLIERVGQLRPDLKFHVLTNAQHFESTDIDRLRADVFKRVLWGVPLYSAQPLIHDQIVKKIGAFETLMSTLPIMARSGLQIELRTVILQQNYSGLSDLSKFVARKLPFISVWAIMQLERIGFAKNRWKQQFVDHSSDLTPLRHAVSTAKAQNLNVSLFNIPYCTVTPNLRSYLSQSISDWKQSFPDDCNDCRAKHICTGFFEWHSTLEDFALGGAL